MITPTPRSKSETTWIIIGMIATILLAHFTGDNVLKSRPTFLTTQSITK